MRTRVYYIFAFLAYFIWGMTFPFSKLVIPPLSSSTFVFLRSFMGFLFLIVIITVKRDFKNLWIDFTRHFWSMFFLALIPYSFSYVLQFYAIQFTTATNQSIIAQTATIWVVIYNFLLFKRRPELKFLLGAGFGIFGVLLLITTKGLQFSSEHLIGDLLSLLAFLSWASYTALSKPLSQKMHPLSMTCILFWWGSIFLGPLAFIEGAPQQWVQLDVQQWLIMLYLGFICTGLAYFLHIMALSGTEVKSEYVVYFGLLMPIVATVFSLIFLDEQLTWRIGLGALCIMVSVGIIQSKGIKNAFQYLKLKVKKE